MPRNVRRPLAARVTRALAVVLALVVVRTVVVDIVHRRAGPPATATVPTRPPTPSALASPSTRIVRVPDHARIAPPVGTVVDVYAAYEAADPTGTIGQGPGRAVAVARGAVVLATGAMPTKPAAHDLLSGSPDTTSVTSDPSVTLLIRTDDTAPVAFAVAFGAITLAIAPVEDACCSP